MRNHLRAIISIDLDSLVSSRLGEALQRSLRLGSSLDRARSANVAAQPRSQITQTAERPLEPGQGRGGRSWRFRHGEHSLGYEQCL